MRPLYIIGAGGMGLEAALLAEEINAATPKWEIRGYVTGRPEEVGSPRPGYSVVATDEQVLALAEALDVALAVGDPRLLQQLAQRYRRHAAHIGFPNLIHPRAEVARHDVEMGDGNLVCSGVTLTLPVRIGSYNIVNIGATLHHEVVLGDCNLIGPGAILLGASRLGSRTFLGAGAIVLPGVSVGDGAVIGAGAVVRADVSPSTTVAGVPARRLPTHD